MSNQIKLLLFTIVGVGIGAFLIFQGFNGQILTLEVESSPSPVSSPVELAGSQIQTTNESTSSGSSQILSKQFKESGQVVKVIDGDTIDVKINGQVKRIRYIGINTPETVDPNRPKQCFGQQASAENKKLVNGQTVFLAKDVSETDRYGRLLRFVYLSLDSGGFLLVNDYLVREGFANVSTYPPDVKMAEQFKLAEQEARSKMKGLWRTCQ